MDLKQVSFNLGQSILDDPDKPLVAEDYEEYQQWLENLKRNSSPNQHYHREYFSIARYRMLKQQAEREKRDGSRVLSLKEEY